METTINLNEKAVLDCCKQAAVESDNGAEFMWEDLLNCKSSSMTNKQLQGYVSQLVQKGYLVQLENCYFDFELIKK